MSHPNESVRKLKHQYDQKQQELTQLAKRLENIRRGQKLPLTDHAIVQYLQRVKGVNLDELHAEIVTADLHKYYTALGDGTFPIGVKNIRAVVKDGVVITILK